jgi:hypothetical protein
MPLRTLVPMHMPLPQRCCHAVCRLRPRHGRQPTRCKSTEQGVQWLTSGSDSIPQNLDAIFILAGAPLPAALHLMSRRDGTEATKVHVGHHST